MNPPITLGFFAVVGAVIFMVWYTPNSREGHAPNVPQVELAKAHDERVADDHRPKARAKTATKVEESDEEDPIDDAGPPEPDVGQGPWKIDLGSHTIYLKDEGQVMRVHPVLWLTRKATQNEVGRRRRALVRMLFFLGSHRRAEGARGPGGQQRFQEDLLARFRNVVKTGPIARLELAQYEITDAPKPDEAD